MAIFGSLQTLSKQAQWESCRKVFAFINDTDLEAIFAEVAATGKNKVVEIDGKDIYAIFQSYTTRLASACRLEGHRKYADLQYMYKGAEMLGYCDVRDKTCATEYSEDDDIYFCEAEKFTHVRLAEGEGALLMPEDLHAPGMADGAPQPVRKVVFKIRL